jgi:cation transport ATPase
MKTKTKTKNKKQKTKNKKQKTKNKKQKTKNKKQKTKNKKQKTKSKNKKQKYRTNEVLTLFILYFFYTFIIMQKIYYLINNNPTMIALLIYCVCFIVLTIIKPNFLFLPNGGLRKFGIGYQKKTIMPLWLTSIILGIFSFMVVLYIINFM